MKKVLIFLLLALTTITVSAGNYDYLVILDNNSNATSFASNGLTLSYSGTTLTVTTSSGSSSTFDTKLLSKMYFSSTTTGIAAINAEVDGESVHVFDISGRPRGTFNSVAEAIGKLPKGVYVMKGDQKTIKMTVK